MKNKNTVYLLIIVIVILAFLLLGGGPWVGGMMHGGRSLNMNHLSPNANHWNWVQNLISLAIGFLLGFFAARRKW